MKCLKVLLLLVLVLSCDNERNSNYFDISFDLPEYYHSYDFKKYAKENDISLTFTPIYKSEMFYKDSLNSCFLSFKQFDPQDFESTRDVKDFIIEAKGIMQEESVGKWISFKQSLKEKYGYALLEFNDTISNTYSSVAFWKIDKNMYRISFYTDIKSDDRIVDFKNLVEEMSIAK